MLCRCILFSSTSSVLYEGCVWWHTSLGQGWRWGCQINYKFHLIQDACVLVLLGFSPPPVEARLSEKAAQNRTEGRRYYTALTLPFHYVPLSNCSSIQCCEQSKQYLITQQFDIEEDVSILSLTICTVQPSNLFGCVTITVTAPLPASLSVSISSPSLEAISWRTY